MLKRILLPALCLVLAAMLPLNALGAGSGRRVTLSQPEDLLRLAEKCMLDSYSQGLQVVLTADLDMTGTDFQGIPWFGGTFDGGGYRISGLNITREGSVTGFIRYLPETGTVKDLTLSGNVNPGGSGDTVGGFVGHNAGRITGCTFEGKVSGTDAVGGIAGSNGVTGIIEKATVLGTVEGNHFAGGIAGENTGVIRGSINEAMINATPQQNRVEISDITLETLTGSENAVTVTDIGGIAGTSSGVIRSCKNRGDVGYKHMGYNIGGIAGSQSGYVTGCNNYGAVSGRKEVGGIVGHLEPGIRMVFSEDTLQTLKGQMETMGELAEDAAAAAQGGAAAISGQVGALRDHTQTAKEALEQLTPSVSRPEGGLPEVDIPDRDTIQAAQNALSGSVSGLRGSMEGLLSATQGAAASISGSLEAVSRQMEEINRTLNGASENLGGTVTDVSDEDTDEDTTGKLYGCENYGAVLADLNAGGIAGAAALETDLDPEADISISGATSLNFDGMLRAVILNCTNRAAVTGRKQNTGGIAGWMDLGLVKGCVNTGAVSGGDYVGGIAGRSGSYIRACSAKSALSGDSCVGGIAGQGQTVTDCRSMVALEGREKLGAVLGSFPSGEELSGNCYLPVGEDPGGVDGISYADRAQGLTQKEFLKLEGLSDVFRWVTVRFVFADGSEETVRLPQGAALEEGDIPALPEAAGQTARWEGLAEGSIAFDTTVYAAYTPYRTVIAAESLREDGRPVILAEGSFPPGAEVTVSQAEELPQASSAKVWQAGTLTVTSVEAVAVGEILEAITITVPEGCGEVVYRYLPPENARETALLLVRQEDGSWKHEEPERSGSYLVFDARGTETVIALVAAERELSGWIIGGIAVLAAAAVVAVLLVRRKRKKGAV